MTCPVKLQASLELLICNACGTQYPVTEKSSKDECKVCDDPRQFVPPEGQTFTTLAELAATSHKNVWWQDKRHAYVWSVRTEPSFAIGNRAELIQTPSGNILWDLIPFLDQDTVDRINELGGLKAIVISHPHYYSTWADWSRTFRCPVYVGKPDKEWLERTETPGAELRFLTDTYTPIIISEGQKPDTITAILAGGHFPGSLLLHHIHNNAVESRKEGLLFIADTIFPVPSAMNPVPGKSGVISFSFFWSIPNRIPLHPDDILSIWHKVKDYNFQTCFGAFKGMDVYTMDNEGRRHTGGVKGRLLESCKIFVRASGWNEHGILAESL